MKQVLNADKIRIEVVGETPALVDKKDYEALVVRGNAGAKITINHGDQQDGTGKALYKEVQLEPHQTQANVDITGALQFIEVADGIAYVFGDKRDVSDVYGVKPDHELHGFIDKDRNWGR